jgi:hypothetical protein
MSVHFYPSGVLAGLTSIQGNEFWGDGTKSIPRRSPPRSGPSPPRRHNFFDFLYFRRPVDASTSMPLQARRWNFSLFSGRIPAHTVGVAPARDEDVSPVFSNNSQCEHQPVEVQLAVTLYRFGHSGNAAGHSAVARWAGVGHGTVSLMTRRVMTAILRPDFMSDAVRFPTDKEKEAAKSWVEARLCKAWRDGWCLVDGTLIPLYDRPHWYGESYFDRKCNYSLNIQVCSVHLLP